MLVAEHLGAEILSVDSMQVYRGMDIGTAKPAPDDRKRVEHHMIDLVDPDTEYSVAEFQRDARRIIELDGPPLLIVGGSGLHFRAAVDPLEFPPHDPGLRAELERTPPSELVRELVAIDAGVGESLDLANPRRLVRAVEVLRLTGASPSVRAASPQAMAVREFRSLWPLQAFGLDPGNRLADTVEVRFDAMLAAGLLDEVRGLVERMGRTASQAVGYKELAPVVSGKVDLEIGRANAIRATLGLAKRQRTYFRRDPRIRWIGGRSPARAADDILNQVRTP
jgi:tRNA dimethylallyltransferase